ncbi:Nudix_Hydrolase domain containing protein [uncultured Caudovirales phage]|uniref:Nudix_Hydrolase domain containing protein n=1 Tax=uncultured Caudovirales phage TaxID=2100421 RepID=A0A6J7WVT9_9CAUD|nr:Nudix_Hydrolase domain containing protein [uncultured Caudovirales phage]
MTNSLHNIRNLLKTIDRSQETDALEKAGWSIKIKGKPGYHSVKDVVDMGSGNQNSYILHDGSTVHHSDVDDLSLEAKPKTAHSAPGNVAKVTQLTARLKRSVTKSSNTPTSLDAIKKKYRDKKELPLDQQIKNIKQANSPRSEKPFSKQIAEVKLKYSNSLGKSQDDGLPFSSVVCVIHNGNVLMGRRNDTKRYVFPGGMGNPGETPEETAKRELKEETGLTPDSLVFIGKKSLKSASGRSLNVNVFACHHPHDQASGNLDPDQEVSTWESVPVQNGKLPETVEQNLHIPRPNNLVLQLLESDAK